MGRLCAILLLLGTCSKDLSATDQRLKLGLKEISSKKAVQKMVAMSVISL